MEVGWGGEGELIGDFFLFPPSWGSGGGGGGGAVVDSQWKQTFTWLKCVCLRVGFSGRVGSGRNSEAVWR